VTDDVIKVEVWDVVDVGTYFMFEFSLTTPKEIVLTTLGSELCVVRLSAKKSKPREGLKFTHDVEISLPQEGRYFHFLKSQFCSLMNFHLFILILFKTVSDSEPTITTPPPILSTNNQKVIEGSHVVGDLDARIVDVYRVQNKQPRTSK
jgi:hypothetical protein